MTNIDSLMQIWTVLQDYVDPRMLAVLVGIWALGFILKTAPRVENWMIVWILLAASLLAAISLLGFNAHAIIQGIIVAAIAGWAHQLIKQTAER